MNLQKQTWTLWPLLFFLSGTCELCVPWIEEGVQLKGDHCTGMVCYKYAMHGPWDLMNIENTHAQDSLFL